jgi:hypothetical protein
VSDETLHASDGAEHLSDHARRSVNDVQHAFHNVRRTGNVAGHTSDNVRRTGNIVRRASDDVGRTGNLARHTGNLISDVGNEVSDTGKDFSDIGKNIRKSGNAVEMKDLGQNQPEIGIFNHGWAWMNTNCALQPGKSGGGPPQSKTWRKFGTGPACAKRLGVRQPSGALERGARCWAMTEIKLGRTPHSLPRRSNSPRRNAVKTGAKTGAFRT